MFPTVLTIVAYDDRCCSIPVTDVPADHAFRETARRQPNRPDAERSQLRQEGRRGGG